MRYAHIIADMHLKPVIAYQAVFSQSFGLQLEYGVRILYDHRKYQLPLMVP